jgi:hypothetical protein
MSSNMQERGDRDRACRRLPASPSGWFCVSSQAVSRFIFRDSSNLSMTRAPPHEAQSG